MIRLIIIGILTSLITVAANYATIHYRKSLANQAEAPPPQKLETRKTKEINVPKLRDGVVAGYIVMQFSYVVDTTASSTAATSADAFVVDEAFRYVYDDDTINFAHLQKMDLHKLSDTVIKNTNARLKGNVITDVAFQEFTFVPYTEAASSTP